MAANKKKDEPALEREIRRLVRRRPAEVRKAITAFRKLARGKRRELGPGASYFVSLLVAALRAEARSKRARAKKASR
jgi:hypothetical protein